ncbi:hypothetical protein MMC30_000777 [Trapelia coarctata]|nr:hypothetical protein [Trapelia coarctata]
MAPWPRGYTRPETIVALNPGPSRRNRATATPATASTRETALPSGPFMMEDSANTLCADDHETWMEPGRHPTALRSVKKATQDAIHRVLQNPASATPFARWCTWAIIKHYRLRVSIRESRTGALHGAWKAFVSTAGRLLVRACQGEGGHPTVEAQDELRAVERELTAALMRRSETLRRTAWSLNLALVLEVEDEYGERLRGMDFWDTVRVRGVIEDGRRGLRTKWIELPAVDVFGEDEREGLRTVEGGWRGLLEGFDASERLVRKFEGSYLADITNCPPKIQGRRRVEVARRGENVAPVRVAQELRVLDIRR